MTKPTLLAAIALAMLTTACTGSDLEESCAGELIPNCLPYEYSVITGATISPEAVELDNPMAAVDFRVTFDKCDAAPFPHEIIVRAISETGMIDEMGEPIVSIVNLTTLLDDGESNGDPVAQDGVIEASVPNVFVGPRLSAREEITVRFDSRAPANCTTGTCLGGTCRGPSFEMPYRIGARFVPPDR